MKFALCLMPDHVQASATLERMVHAQIMLDYHTSHTLSLPGGKAGYVATSDQWSNVALFREHANGNRLLLTGVPIERGGGLDAKLEAIIAGDYQNASRALTTLDGAFVAIFWDNTQQKLLIVTDMLGMQPLYLFQRENMLLMATEVKGITASGLMDVDMDFAGWGCFLSFGHLIGNRTMVEGIVRSEAASIYLIDPQDATYQRSTYWTWPAPQPDTTLDDIDVEEVVDILSGDIRGYAEHHSPGTLLLSGGFDSRGILTLLQHQGITPQALTVTHQDELLNADGYFARRIARISGLEYQRVKPRRDFFSTPPYLDYMLMNDVATPSLYLFIAQVAHYLSPQRKAIWEGAALDKGLNPSSQPPGGFAACLAKTCLPRDADLWQAAGHVFGATRTTQMYDEFSAHLRQELALYSDDEFGVYEFTVKNLVRHRTGPNPLVIYANAVLPFTPGFSKAFWNAYGGVSYKVKARGQIYFKIFRRYAPQLAHLPVISGYSVNLDQARGAECRKGRLFHWFDQHRVMRDLQLKARRVLTGTWQYWPESVWLKKTLHAAHLDHPEIQAQRVRELQTLPVNPAQTVQTHEQRIVFYWQIWRWIMEQKLTRKDKRLLGL